MADDFKRPDHSEVNAKVIRELIVSHIQHQEFSFVNGIEHVFDVIQKLVAHTRTTSSRIRFPMRLRRLLLTATSTSMPSTELR